MEYVLPLQKLIEKFCTLRGVGYKTAVRYAFSVLDMSEEEAAEFAGAIISAKRDIHPCEVCGNLSDGEECGICSDAARDKSVICVVEDTRAVMALEKVKEFNGLYHVLGGVISPMNNVGPEQLRIKELLSRINSGDVRELIIATNPNIEGETTAMYISKLVAPLGIKVTRLAYGVPVGADLEYADEMTLMRALDGRRQI
ncbi:MAG: recombination protein RecR [Ruminococcaceae bacterium]|nr:recombination protein RecR [Oscillospiraceae bacterium]